MDILLQYLNVNKRKQEFVKVVDVPFCTVFQVLRSGIADNAVNFVDYMQQAYRSTYFFVGIIDASYSNRITRSVFSYTDFRRLTCGLDEVSSIG